MIIIMNTLMVLMMALATATLTGCGQAHYVAPEAKPFVDAFLVDAKAHGKDLSNSVDSIDFGDAKGAASGEHSMTEGVCIKDGGGKKILLDRAYWDGLDDDSRMVLVYHELGHCLLDRGHKSDAAAQDWVCTKRDETGKCVSQSTYSEPASIMFPSVIMPGVVASDPDYRKALIDELFNGGK